MLKVIILIGEESRTTDQLLSQAIFNDSNIQGNIKIISNYEALIYRSLTLTEVQNNDFIFMNLKAENLLADKNIIQFFFYPTTQKSFDFCKTLKKEQKKQLTILIDDSTSYFLETYKKDYETESVFHIKKIEDAFETILQEEYIEYTINDNEMAIIIGGQGNGKTKLFQKVTHNNRKTKKQFNYHFFFNERIQLVDAPSLDIDLQLQESVLESYSAFFRKSSQFISTFFFVVKFDRYDTMKANFLSNYGFFKCFTKQIVVAITNWNDNQSQQQNLLMEQIQNYFLKNFQIKNVIFVLDTMSPEDLLNLMKAQLTGHLGIDTTGTVFVIEEDKEYTETLQKKFSKTEDQLKEFKISTYNQKKQELLQKNKIIQEENESLKQKLREIENTINLNKQQIQKNQQSILYIDQDLKSLNGNYKQSNRRKQN